MSLIKGAGVDWFRDSVGFARFLPPDSGDSSTSAGNSKSLLDESAISGRSKLQSLVALPALSPSEMLGPSLGIVNVGSSSTKFGAWWSFDSSLSLDIDGGSSIL